jgi:riboflavin transporter FmnP
MLFFNLALIILIYRFFLAKRYKKKAKGATAIKVGFWLVEGVLIAYLGWLIIIQFPGLFFV